jgi:hypothetical protein
MKFDEMKLLTEIQRRQKNGEHPYVREVVADIGMNGKRAAYLCEKWTDKGWYEYGVNVLAGWLTKEGLEYERPF